VDAALYFHPFCFLEGCEGCKLKVVAPTLKSVQLCVFCSLLVAKFGLSWRFFVEFGFGSFSFGCAIWLPVDYRALDREVLLL